MKTSSKLILGAVFLLLAALFVYDELLKTAYRSGSYKDPYHGYQSLNFKDFDAADLSSASTSNVKFIQGPYSVKIAPDALSFTTVKQIANRLQIASAFEGNYFYNRQDYILIISCPKLIDVNASAVYTKNKGTQTITDTIVRDEWHMRQVSIDGFNEDSISIKQDYGSTIIFSNNHIRALTAVIATSDSSGSRLIIQKNNQVKKANVTILNRGNFWLDGKPIQNLKYLLADSAKIMFNGSARSIINNSNPQQK